MQTLLFPPSCVANRLVGSLPLAQGGLEKQKQKEVGGPSEDYPHQALHPQGRPQKQGGQKTQGWGSPAVEAPCGQVGAGSPPGGGKETGSESSLSTRLTPRFSLLCSSSGQPLEKRFRSHLPLPSTNSCVVTPTENTHRAHKPHSGIMLSIFQFSLKPHNTP